MRMLLGLGALLALTPVRASAPQGARPPPEVAAPALALGFSREALAGAVGKASLAAADAWVAKYEGDKNGANLRTRLDKELAGFVKEGSLGGGK